jgi:glycosyltransferase involved in cell wall biosynthesis
MKTIAIEAVGINRAGGGRTSILNLLQNMFAADHDTRYIVLVSENEPSLAAFSNVEQISMPIANRFLVRLYLQLVLPALVRREQVDLVHFIKNLGVFGVRRPYVVTVHDLTTLLQKDLNSLIDVLYWQTVEPLTVRHAVQVVTVSHDAAKDIERFYGVPEQSVRVIYWAPHTRFTPIHDAQRLEDLHQRYTLPKRYILFLGILARKKNLPTLLKSLAHLRDRDPKAPHLVVVGRRYPQSDDTESVPMIRQLGLDDYVHFTGSVPDEDLPLFYAASELYVLPSLHEGFGIPCLEAMACGTPVIVTRGGALAEIVGNAGWVVDDPMDHIGLAAAIERVLGDVRLRQKMIEQGFKHVAMFSWKRSAQQMLDVYHSVMEEQH